MQPYHEGLYEEILGEISQLPTVDAHEHLPTEASRQKERLDFYTLFQHYCAADLVAAGATQRELDLWKDRSVPLKKRWESFKPFLSAIRTTGYARSALIVVRDILGFPDLNDDTYEDVSQALQEGNRPGRYDEILRGRCNLVACIQCLHLGYEGPDYFYHLSPGPEVVDLTTRDQIRALSKRCDVEVTGLADLLACMDKTVERWRKTPAVVGIKSAHAYTRTLDFRPTPRDEAETILHSILQGDEIAPAQAKAMQDFLMYELVGRAVDCGLPMVFHTGLQAGNRNRISNANPLLLQPLLKRFGDAPFDLFHGGMPWVREIAVLARYFPGVHLNMAWMHIINPRQARSALAEWLDMVPNTKIFGFGGDYAIVEKVYGHLKLARENVARVLTEKVMEGAYTRDEASLVARRLMLENPDRFYQLGVS